MTGTCRAVPAFFVLALLTRVPAPAGELRLEDLAYEMVDMERLAVAAEPPIGDYDSEPRLADGHVDCAELVAMLQEMHANTYFWLIWHAATDWEDLHTFLPMARKAGISVWVYLVPHSESGPDYPYSEPFRLDYVRWAQEIAKLSLEHDNLPGYVIDDFAANIGPGPFTAEYIKLMVDAGRNVNPKLLFYPLLYYPEISPRLVGTLAPLVDGVVAAYPQSKEQVETALSCLNDEWHLPAAVNVSYPPATPSEPGDHGFMSTRATVTDAAKARLSFRCMDDFSGPTGGYHWLQARVDEQVVWEGDCEGGDDAEVTVDLRGAVGGKTEVRLSFGVADAKGVSQFPLEASFSALQVEGLRAAGVGFGSAESWEKDTRGAFQADFTAETHGENRFRLPLIIMPAGSREEYKGRYTDEPSTANITARVRTSLRFVEEGKAEGVVIYCLDKTRGNPDLESIARTYRAFWSR